MRPVLCLLRVHGDMVVLPASEVPPRDRPDDALAVAVCRDCGAVLGGLP